MILLCLEYEFHDIRPENVDFSHNSNSFCNKSQSKAARPIHATFCAFNNILITKTFYILYFLINVNHDFDK